MTQTSKTQKLQEISTQALRDGDQATYYEAQRELAQIAEYADWYRRRWADRPIHR